MKAIRIFISVLLVGSLALALVGCAEGSDTRVAEEATVEKQDATYNKTQPIPLFNYSLPRDLWIQFYKSSTSNVVRTWSVGVSYNGAPVTEVMESIGYPIPMDTQLTNPLKIADSYQGGYAILPQSEPNGLYTSPNTNATIVMTADSDGKVAPVYIESHVLCWPYPVKYNPETHVFERVKGGQSSIKLDVNSK